MKKLFITLGLIIALAIAALIAIPLFIDPNDFKSQIVEQVKNTRAVIWKLPAI